MSAQFIYFRIFIALLLVTITATAATEEMPSIYETVSDASIGPVFLTPSQRVWLDQRRLLPPPAAGASSNSDPDAPVQRVTRKPAGYIVSSTGRRSEWSDGDFVESTASDEIEMPFPGEVDLLRHDNDADDEEGDDGENDNDN